MKVRKIMSSDVAACNPDTSLAAAAGLMWQYDCGVIPVIDRNQMDQSLSLIRIACGRKKLFSAPLFLSAWFGKRDTRKILTDTRWGA